MPFDDLFAGKVTPTPAIPAQTTPAQAATPSTTAPAPSSDLASYVPQNLGNLGAGVMQGAVRDPLTTLSPILNPATRWMEQNIPGVRSWDERMGMTPGSIEAANQAYQASPAAGSLWGMGGRLAGNVAASSLIPIPGAGATGVVANALRGAAAGGIGSALTSGGYGENPLTAGAEGALGGGVIGGATGALMRPLNTFLTNTADRLGIDLSRGQATGGKLLQRLEELPGAGGTSQAATQNEQMVSAVQRSMGVPETGKLDLPAVQNARRAAGQDMGKVAGTMSIDGTAPAGSGVAGGAPLSLTDRLDEIYNQAATLGTDTPQAKAADALRNQINTSIMNNGGTMPGSDFKKFVATGNTLDRLGDHSNSEVQGVASEVRQALFNAAGNTPANPPDVLKDFQDAQLHYKAAMTANDAIKQTGSTDAMTPAALKQAIFRHYSDQLAAGNSGVGYDMPDLGRMLQALPKLASSGTAERAAFYGALAGGGGLGAYSYLANPHALTAALYASAVPAAAAAAGRVSRFGPGMGVPYAGPALNALGAYTNPLLPRLLGQGTGNLLATGNMPQPSGQ